MHPLWLVVAARGYRQRHWNHPCHLDSRIDDAETYAKRKTIVAREESYIDEDIVVLNNTYGNQHLLDRLHPASNQ
jgi:hypothetical protein